MPDHGIIISYFISIVYYFWRFRSVADIIFHYTLTRSSLIWDPLPQTSFFQKLPLDFELSPAPPNYELVIFSKCIEIRAFGLFFPKLSNPSLLFRLPLIKRICPYGHTFVWGPHREYHITTAIIIIIVIISTSRDQWNIWSIRNWG